MRQRLVLAATLAMFAGCTPRPDPAAGDEYVPHGRFAPAVPLAQALRDCRAPVETAGRQGSPAIGPGPLRQIPDPPVFRPEYASVRSCMEAKGYRRAAPGS